MVDIPPPPKADVRQVRANAYANHDVSPLFAHCIPGNDRLIASGVKHTDKGMSKETISTGGFNSLSIPRGWDVDKRDVSGGYLYRLTPPHGNQSLGPNDTFIGVYERGKALNQADESVFQNLLKEHGNQKLSKLLYDSSWEKSSSFSNDQARKQNVESQMKALAGVLGYTQLGDNQFTNKRAAPDPKAPQFHIDRAEIQTINGKPVLHIEGYSPNLSTGQPDRYFSGIFAPRQNGGMHVHEVFLQSSDKMHFMANKAPFKKALASIIW